MSQRSPSGSVKRILVPVAKSAVVASRAAWKSTNKLFIPATTAVLSSQVILGRIMVAIGNSTPIAIISAGTIVFKLIEN